MGIKVLLVEDDRSLREALADTLLLAGHDFHAVGSAEEALTAVAREAGSQQPHVSKVLRALEASLGVRLLERSTTGATSGTGPTGATVPAALAAEAGAAE